MLSLKLFGSCALLLLSGLVATMAQTGGDLRQKYGAPDDNGKYTVRSGVLMSVTVTSEERISDVWIEPKSAPRTDDPSEQGISSKVLAGLIDEFAPLARRGHYIRHIAFNGGCTSIRGAEYENVTIQQTSLCKKGGGTILSSAEIHWKK